MCVTRNSCQPEPNAIALTPDFASTTPKVKIRRPARCIDRRSLTSSVPQHAVHYPGTIGTIPNYASAAESRDRRKPLRNKEGFQSIICFPDRMPKESDHGRVRGNVTVMHHDGRSSLLDRIEHFCAAIEPMHFEANAVAGLQIGFDCFANRVSGNLKIERCSLHHRQWLARDESQLRVQRDGAEVITGLNEANAGNVAFCSARKE